MKSKYSNKHDDPWWCYLKLIELQVSVQNAEEHFKRLSKLSKKERERDQFLKFNPERRSKRRVYKNRHEEHFIRRDPWRLKLARALGCRYDTTVAWLNSNDSDLTVEWSP